MYTILQKIDNIERLLLNNQPIYQATKRRASDDELDEPQSPVSVRALILPEEKKEVLKAFGEYGALIPKAIDDAYNEISANATENEANNTIENHLTKLEPIDDVCYETGDLIGQVVQLSCIALLSYTSIAQNTGIGIGSYLTGIDSRTITVVWEKYWKFCTQMSGSDVGSVFEGTAGLLVGAFVGLPGENLCFVRDKCIKVMRYWIASMVGSTALLGIGGKLQFVMSFFNVAPKYIASSIRRYLCGLPEVQKLGLHKKFCVSHSLSNAKEIQKIEVKGKAYVDTTYYIKITTTESKEYFALFTDEAPSLKYNVEVKEIKPGEDLALQPNAYYKTKTYIKTQNKWIPRAEPKYQEKTYWFKNQLMTKDSCPGVVQFCTGTVCERFTVKDREEASQRETVAKRQKK